MKKVVVFYFILVFFGCDPFVDTFDDSSITEAKMFQAIEVSDSLVYDGGSIRVLTWNVRNGLGRFPWLYDSCGDSVVGRKPQIEKNLLEIANKLNNINADVVLLQEVDILSKRSGYIDQIQFLLDNTSFNYGCYGSMLKADFALKDGHGMVDGGNAILSKYKLEDAKRIPLALRTDQSSIVQYGYLRRNMLKAKIPDLKQGDKDFYVVNIHATAFATDDTKQKHIDKLIEILVEIENEGSIFVSGGDLNSVPPGSEIDFCENDKCEGEVCDGDYKNNEAYYGTYFNHFDGEPDLLVPLYASYNAAIGSGEANLPEHFTHAKSTSYEINNVKFDRKLDYLFTNGSWSSSVTHQGAWELSDHTPVSSYFSFENE